jgi:hypothetical protein
MARRERSARQAGRRPARRALPQHVPQCEYRRGDGESE